MLNCSDHRHPVLVVVLSASVELLIELDTPWMLECSPHARMTANDEVSDGSQPAMVLNLSQAEPARSGLLDRFC
jgi:hypothetical protein